MVNRILKRILVFSSVACLVLASLPSLSFAIDPVTGAAALAGALDAYGMAYGVGTVYDVSSSSGVSSSFEGLWDEFSDYQSNSGSQFDYDSYIANYNQNRSLHGFEHSSGKFAAWYIDTESVEIFDQFWNWLLSGPAEMVRVDNGYFEWSSSSPVSVYSDESFSFNGHPIFKASQVVLANAYQNRVCYLSEPVYCFYDGSSSYTYSCYFLSASPFTGYYQIDNGNHVNISVSSVNYPPFSYVGYSGSAYFSPSMCDPSPSGFTYVVPSSGSMADKLSSIFGPVAADATVTTEGDYVNILPYAGASFVELPDPYSPDYVPAPLDIVTNVPWDSSYNDSDEENGVPVPFPPVDVPLVVDDVLTSISAEDYALVEDPQDPDPDPPPPAPSEIFVPLLPVGLPSFNFSFSGIWHYVREWVSSLGSWFSTLFTIWSALPYAMVVPVYATAVVVIVLGVYKRFFM